MLTVASQDRLFLDLEDGGSRSIGRSEIEQLESSLGTRTYRERGFLIGAGAGVTAGATGLNGQRGRCHAGR